MWPRHPCILTVFVGFISFFSGLICSSILEPSPSARALIGRSFEKPSNDSRSTQPNNASTSIGSDKEPLGLSWYKQSYRNPWSFSTMRTGIDDLMRAFENTTNRDGSLPRVVVSFTSLPRRFAVHAQNTIHMLKGQTYLPDAIYIAVPKVSRRSDDIFDVPQWITSDPLITVLRPEHDLGPATKLIPAIEEELRLGNSKTRIITVDDDNEGRWTSTSLMSLYAYSLYFEDAAIGLTGWNATCMVSDAHCTPEESGVPQRQFSDRLYNFIRPSDDYACHSLFDWLPDYFANCMGAVRKNHVAFVDVLEGFKGVLYQPRFFNMTKLKSILSKKTPECFLMVDDVWFSGWLGVRNVSRLVVNPAIHKDSAIAMALAKKSAKRKLAVVSPKRNAYEVSSETQKKPEEGLHSLGVSFAEANHKAVRWFEKFGAWTEDLWKKPDGFKYPSEDGRKTEPVHRMVLMPERH